MAVRVLETPRLSLFPVSIDDVDVLHAMWRDAEVRRYLWDDVEIDRETARAVVEQSVRDWERHGWGLWLVHKRDRVVGFAGFRSSEETGQPELLFGFLPQAWHRGLATEAAQTALRYLFDVVRCHSAWAATDAPNVASVRVLERLGMQFDRREMVDGRDTLFYRLAGASVRRASSHSRP